jgi:hypothetical protein
MRLERKPPPMPGRPGRTQREVGEARGTPRREEDRTAAHDDEHSGTFDDLGLTRLR